MSAGALSALSPTTNPFILRAGPRVLTANAPVPFPGDEGSLVNCTISETAEGSPNQMTFSIEDVNGTIDFDFGELVEMVDRRSGSERLLFGGYLVEAVSQRRQNGKGRILRCTALGYDAWLDWRVVTSWSSKTDKNGRVTRITNDRAMVQQLINRYAPFLEAPASTVSSTNDSMEVLNIRKATLREALERVAESATIDDTDSTRYFYVDNAQRLHYYRGSENLTAPYRIADGSYVRTVLGTSGLVAFWPLRETGTTMHEAVGGLSGTLSGGYTQGVDGGVVNEPAYKALTLNGSSGYMAASGSALHPGDTFSFECWYKRNGTGSTQMLWAAEANDFEVRFDSNDKIALRKTGVNTIWVTDDAFADTDDWHHLVVTKSGSTRRIYVDGVVQSSSGTNQTIVASGSGIEVGRRIGDADRYFDGSLQMVALYDVALSAATVEAHYNQGVSLVPEEWEYTESAFEGREAVYVSGANASGTGWVRVPSRINTAFGAPNRQPERQEIIDRDDAEGPGKKRAYGRWFLAKFNDPVRSGRFRITGFDGWRVGQRVYLTSTPDGLSAYPAEIKAIETDVLFGSGVLTYDIQWGRARWSGSRTVARDRNGRR